MSAEAKKLEIIAWIASLRDNRILEQIYTQIKKTAESKSKAEKKTSHSNNAPPSPRSSEALDMLEKITDAYVASKEPDLSPEQIFTDRMKANDRKIDFN